MEQQRSLKTAQQQQLEEGEEIQHRPSPVEQLQKTSLFRNRRSFKVLEYMKELREQSVGERCNVYSPAS
ncbi:hypothetical protein Q3G72_030363 [Acer saccharum]|nr:hypothetical protein Q3G72_030363 [Acer saccharum]